MFRLVRRSSFFEQTIVLVTTGWWLLVVGTVQANQEPDLYSVERLFAQSQQVYVVVDPKARVIWMKARGLPVRQFGIKAMTWVGDPPARVSVLTVQSKHPVIEPPVTVPPSIDRQEIPDGPKPLTVSDMPIHFEMPLEEGLTLMIHSVRQATVLQEKWDVLGGWFSQAYSRMKVWSQGLWGEDSRRLILEMSPTEAQAFYWALVPRTNLILHPGK